MRIPTSTLIILLTAPLAAARNCKNITVPVQLCLRQPTFDVQIPQTSLDVVDFFLNVTRQGSNFSALAMTGYHVTSGRYEISAMFCRPDNLKKFASPTVQVLTHGIGFDKTYWDLPYNAYNYSYINHALSHGYSTLSYDRLGIGNSSHGEPLNEIQSFLEVEALRSLTVQLRNGTLPTVPHKFPKVVHVGHSFGSAQTYSLANLYPDLTDAIVLTGFTMNASFVPYFASGGNFVLANKNQPLRFGSGPDATATQAYLDAYFEVAAEYIQPIDLSTLPAPQNLPNGYLVPADAEAIKYLFFSPKHFDPAILTDVAAPKKQPVTLGEVLTLGLLPPTNAYHGPVLAITGRDDLPYCGSDCLNTGGIAPSIPAMLGTQNFPNVPPANFSAYIQPDTGHGINLHYNASGTYEVIQEFLSAKGMQSF